MNFNEYVILFLMISILQFLSSIWIKSRLTKSIEHEYDKKLEEFRFNISKRDKAANISMFFAKWIKYRGNENKILNKNELFDYYEELNKMSFELSLWVDDEKLLKDIMLRLNNAENALPVRDILIKARQHISKNTDKISSFDANNIIVWPTEKVAKENNLF